MALTLALTSRIGSHSSPKNQFPSSTVEVNLALVCYYTHLSKIYYRHLSGIELRCLSYFSTTGARSFSWPDSSRWAACESSRLLSFSISVADRRVAYAISAQIASVSLDAAAMRRHWNEQD